ncbi:MAG: class II aldolase/adducin family protein [Actinomycetota bacterium]|nr:MAG: class II aldolase/adducin family protein [Actinomycetota bacterium]
MEMSRAERQILEAIDQLFTNQVMSHSGHANLSARIDMNTYLITTKGAVRNLTAKDLALVDLDGKVLDGNLDPTNLEILDMHGTIYRYADSVEAVIHTHSPNVLAFALANKPLPCRYEALLRFGQADDVPVAKWGPRGSKQSIDAIESALSENPNTSSVILANHGLLAFGSSPLATVSLISALEESAEAEIAAASIGGAVSFPQGALEAVRESMKKAKS